MFLFLSGPHGHVEFDALIEPVQNGDEPVNGKAVQLYVADAGKFKGDQIRFIDQIIEHLARNGVMDLEALYEPPFTDMHYEGIDGILPEHADKVISIIRQVNANAKAA